MDKQSPSNTTDKLWSGDFALTFTTNLLLFMGFHMLTAAFSYFVISLGADLATAGLVTGMFSVASVLMRPIAGWILDHRGRRVIMLIGIAGMVAAPLLYGVFAFLIIAVILRILHGMTWSCATTAVNTVAADIIPRRRFGEGMGYMGLAVSLATAIAPATGLAMMRGYGFNTLFIVTAAICLLSLFLALRLHIEPLAGQQSRRLLRHDIAGLLNRESMPAAVIMLCFMLPYGSITTYVALYAESEALGGGGMYFTCLAATTALMRVATGRVADKYGEGPIIFASVACEFVAFMLLAFVRVYPAFIVSALLLGMGFGMMTPSLQAMSMRCVPAERRGSAASTYLCSFDVGIGLGGVISGQLVKYLGYVNTYAIMPLFLLLSLVIYLCWGRHSPSAFRNHPQ